MILGFVTTLRGLVNLPFIIGRMKGFDSTPNFDEYNFSIYAGINPKVIAVLTLLIILASVLHFSIKAYRYESLQGIIKRILSVLSGLLFWGTFGVYILP